MTKTIKMSKKFIKNNFMITIIIGLCSSKISESFNFRKNGINNTISGSKEK